jgi:hypothetical protein
MDIRCVKDLSMKGAEEAEQLPHPDQAVCRLEVVAPIRAQRLLAANVPEVQGEAAHEKK